MSLEQRFVFDTSATISALLFEQSVPAQAFRLALESGRILISQATLLELSGVLGRKKFDPYLTHEEREQFLIMLLHEAEAVEINEEVQACRDPKDDKFLELAVNGQASYIVTGDHDLLVLNPFRGISILQPVNFLIALSQAPKSKPN